MTSRVVLFDILGIISLLTKLHGLWKLIFFHQMAVKITEFMPSTSL
jgi:hypothetical protein